MIFGGLYLDYIRRLQTKRDVVASSLPIGIDWFFFFFNLTVHKKLIFAFF